MNDMTHPNLEENEMDNDETAPDDMERRFAHVVAACAIDRTLMAELLAAIARDAAVREIVADWRINSLTAGWNAVEHVTAIAAHYPEPADDSDIMPGSEFDGPVVM